MNIFQKSIKEKRDKVDRMRMAHALVSAEITKAIEIEPTTDMTYSFDQVRGYSFFNEKRGLPYNKWIVNKHYFVNDELHWNELDYTDDDEVSLFFHKLSITLISAEDIK